MTDLAQLAARAAATPHLFSLKGRVALVVGGTRGLGQAMALALAAAGADVCIAGRGPGGLEETAQAVGSLGRRATSCATDASDERQVERLIARVLEAHGRLDVLVNSQGTVALQPSADFDTDEWQRVMDVNVKSVFLCCKHAGRAMLAQGKGKIINVSSVRGFQGRAQDLAYAPSKGAVNQLTRSLAIEWGPHGICVNAIAPTFTPTDLGGGAFLQDPAKLEWVLSRIPMRRLGRLEDLFGPVVFLASDASDFVNGHILAVDGGWLAA